MRAFKPGAYASQPIDPNAPRVKGSYIGAPAAFALELACQPLADAFASFGLYVVGSCLKRSTWRDVDLVMIMADEDFRAEFPDAGPIEENRWEFDAKWLLLTVAISAHLSKLSGLPVDFKFQPQSHANGRHRGPRNAVGMRFAKS